MLLLPFMRMRKAFFQLDVPVGTQSVTASYVGYQPRSVNLEALDPKTLLVIPLVSDAVLPEVEVTGHRALYGQTASILTPSVSSLVKTPALLGEVDILKSLALLPGISSGTEGTAGIQIRGGNANQTHLLVDGIPFTTSTTSAAFYRPFLILVSKG
ncbi:MAG: TonB-dependent receptor plug domain-containing protein [Saprospiraceae bacterium]